MKIYLVGGAVRDIVLRTMRPDYMQYSSDYDYVVVGASIQDMLKIGYTPIGKDFPVFLHPVTKSEYALARRERKTAQGYAGFEFYTSPDVTLEQDLLRRDLTINAMALPVDDQHKPLSLNYLIDPLNARQDLANGMLKHVSDAFIEDPLRILRVARFAARFNFKVHEDTMLYMQNMVKQQELQHLAAERIWREMHKGLSEKYAYFFVDVLQACGAWQNILPECSINNTHAYITFLKKHNHSAVNNICNDILNNNAEDMLDKGDFLFLMLLLNIEQEYIKSNTSTNTSKQATNICTRLKLNKNLIHIAYGLHKIYTQLIELNKFDENKMSHYVQACVKLMDNADAIRRPLRFDCILCLCSTYYRSTLNIDINNKSNIDKHIHNIQRYIILCKGICGHELQEVAAQAKHVGGDVKGALFDFRVGYIYKFFCL